ncbi:MAG: hypothetical protein SGPRY_003501 [Prymnesium sp.]
MQDGFLAIDDFGLPDASLDDISARFEALRSSTTATPGANANGEISSVSNGDVMTARMELPSIEPLLANASITRVLQAYLGGEVTMDGYKVTRLATHKPDDVAAYVAARWHHDRAGRRIKLFLFLHDVDCEQVSA